MAARPAGPSVATLLGPRWRGALGQLRQERSGSWPKLLLFGAIGAGFWTAVFGIAYRVLTYLRGVPEIGDLMAAKVLGVVLLAFLAILLLSNLITALSSFFLAKDLDMLVAAPVRPGRLYLAKLAETLVHSSWMVGLLALPVFTAYGMAYDGGFLFPLVALAAFLPFLVLPAAAGSAATLVLVHVFPARRTRDLLGIVAIGALGAAVVGLRLLRPEQLARPEGFRSLVEYLVALRAPTSPLLPSEWAASMVMNWLLRVADPLPPLRLWGAAAAAVAAGAWLHRKLYLAGYSKAQEGARGRVLFHLRRPLERVLRGLAPATREFVLKDLRIFFRDNTQWSQLILLAVLLLVYLVNVRSLPIHSGERVPLALVTVVSFLNLGLAGFVLAAIAVRFVFPAVSLEGRQMWLLRSSPLRVGAMVRAKYWIGTLPLLGLALAITVLTNWLLRVSPLMMAVSVVTLVLYSLATCALALAFGAAYPRFGTENAAQIPTSFGGLVYMMASLCLLAALIAIEAGPVRAHLHAAAGGASAADAGGAGLAGALGAVAAICAAVTAGSLTYTARRLDRLEL